MAYKFQSLAATMSGSLTQEGSFTVKNDAGTTAFTATDAGAVSGSGALSAGGNLQTAGTVKLTGVADAAVSIGDDSIYFLDSDGLMKRDTVADFATAMAGPGIAAVGGAFEVDLDEFSELAATPHATQDEYLISDNGTEKRISVTNAANGAFALVSGDATIAAGGALTIGNDAVETAMLNDNVISGQSELAQGSLAAADEFLLSDGGALKRYGVDSFAKDALALTTEAAMAVADDYVVFLDGGASGETKKEQWSDIVTNIAGDGLTAASGVLALSTSGSSLAITADKLGISGSIAGTGLTFTGGVDSILTIGLDIDGLGALGGTGVAQGDHFVFSDGGAEKKITFSNMEDAIFANVSGDATIAAGGVLTIGAQAVENSMLADDAVGADELAANAVVNASIASNAAIDIDKLDGGSCAASLTDLAQGDLIYAGDVDASNAIKSITFSNLEDAIFGNVSGDATIAAGGALTIASDAVEPSMMNIFDDSLAATDTHFMIGDGTDYSSFALSGDVTCTNAGVVTIGNDAVETAMLNDNVISGQSELAQAGLAAADELLISDGGTLKRYGVDSLAKDALALTTEAAAAVASDYIVFLDGGATGETKKESIVDLVASMAGAGLSAASGQLSVTGNNVSLKADSEALVEGYNYFADASSNATVTMPASPTVGDVVVAKAGNLTSNAVITINKGSADHRIDGLEGIVLESPFAAVTMVYVVADHWKIV